MLRAGEPEAFLKAGLDEFQRLREAITRSERGSRGGAIEPGRGASSDEPCRRSAHRRSSRLARAEHRALHVSPDFQVNPKLGRAVQRRRSAFDADDAAIDWGQAESLALATLVTSGTPVRLTGQDSVRGTFSQRHATFYDGETGRAFTPLAALPDRSAARRNFKQPAFGGRHARLRVRLQRPGTRRAGALGSAVRRLHQRRAGHRRRVRGVGPGEVGTALRTGAAAAPRLGGSGPGSLGRPTRALPRARGGGQPAHLRAVDRGTVLSSAPSAGGILAQRTQAADRVHAQELAPPATGAGPADRSGTWRVPGSAGRRAHVEPRPNEYAGWRCAAEKSGPT